MKRSSKRISNIKAALDFIRRNKKEIESCSCALCDSLLSNHHDYETEQSWLNHGEVVRSANKVSKFHVEWK